MSISFVYEMDQIKVLVTNECNLHCTHCFRSEESLPQMISFVKLCEIVDFAIESKTRKLSFSGGEFFTHPKAYDLLDYCRGKDIDIAILTNATCLDIEYFKRNVNKRLSFQVSIDGKKETHDTRRGQGNFDKTIENVKRLNDIGYHVFASMVLDFNNYKEIIEVMQMPYFCGFNCLPVAYTNDANRALNDENPETRCEYDAVVSMMYKHKKSKISGTQRCHMFPMGLGIRYDGNVYPCAVARDYDMFCMGNLTYCSLKELLANFVKTEEGHLICAYRDNKIDECEKCNSNLLCNRGCRIRAYKLFGNFDAPDLFCCRIFNERGFESKLNDLFWGVK